MNITYHLRIRGLVQGVSYRASTVKQAAALGVVGWVRNRLDGSVEALVQGPPEAVQALIAWAHQGPPAARVDALQASLASTDTGVLTGFVQRETA